MAKLNMKSLLLLISLSVLGFGCGTDPLKPTRTPNLDAQFGQAVEMAKAQQTVNPDGSKNTNPVKGVDGRAAREAIERYEASFQRPAPPQNVFNIGVSGGGGSQ